MLPRGKENVDEAVIKSNLLCIFASFQATKKAPSSGNYTFWVPSEYNHVD